MSVTIHAREMGATVRCNYHGCKATLTTGRIGVRAIRAYAKTQAWIRGLDPGSGTIDSEGGRPSNRKWDVCPEHAGVERRARDERRVAGSMRRLRRDELRKIPPADRLEARRVARNTAARVSRVNRKALKAAAKAVAA